MTCGIYKIETRPGRFYIGSSYNVEKRLGWHRRRLSNGTHPNRKLQNSFSKNGGEACESVIIVCREEDRLLFEQRALSVLMPPLNLHSLAVGSDYWKGKQRPDVGAKISAKLLGRKNGPPSKETRAKISAAQKGKPKPKVSIARKGKPGSPRSPETRAKMTASQKRRWAKRNKEGWRMSEEHKAALSAAHDIKRSNARRDPSTGRYVSD